MTHSESINQDDTDNYKRAHHEYVSDLRRLWLEGNCTEDMTNNPWLTVEDVKYIVTGEVS